MSIPTATNGGDITRARLYSREARLKVCKLLIAKGANANQKSNKGATPWLVACGKGHLDIVKHFVNERQDIEVSDIHGCTGLMYASRTGKLDVVRFLLSIGASVDQTIKHDFTALLWAASRGHLDVCRELMANGANTNLKTRDGGTPGLIACAFGHLDIVKLFVEETGWDIEVSDNESRTGLMYASGKGKLDVVRYLLSKGASIDRIDTSGCGGKTALDKAIAEGHVEVGKRLFLLKNPWTNLRWKGRFSEKDVTSWTPEMCAKLDYNPKDAQQFDDGIFWIDYPSICAFFDVFYVNWSPALFPFRHALHSSWDAGKGPVKDLYTVGENPQYFLELNNRHGTASVWILLRPFDPKPLLEGTRINSPHYLCQLIIREPVYLMTQFIKMLTLATFFPIVEGEYSFSYELMKSAVVMEELNKFALSAVECDRLGQTDEAIFIIRFLLKINMSIPTESTNGGDITADQEGLGPTLTNSDVSEELRLLRARIAQLERQQTMNSPTSSDGFYLVSKDEIEPNNNDKESMAYPEKEQATFELENKMEEYHNKQQQTIDTALPEKQNVGHGIDVSGHGIDVSESARDSAELLYASIIGKENDVRFLLSKGARVDRTTDEGFSPLFLAAGEGHLEVCKLLIANGADTNQKTNNGGTPWFEACERGHLDIVKFFVENGQNIEFAGRIGHTTPLMAYIKANEKKLPYGSTIKKIKQKQNGMGQGCCKGTRGTCGTSDTAVGQRIGVSDRRGCTALMCASRAGEMNIVIFLLSKGARVDRITNEGFSPLFLAAREGHLEVCKLLIANGADTNQKTDDGETPWLEACGNSHLDIGYIEKSQIKLFVENGQDIEATGSIGCTAILEERKELASLFKQQYGCTGLICASRAGKLDVVRFLLSKGARVDRTGHNGFSSLLWAAHRGDLEVCKALVAKGADANQKSHRGESPWLAACEQGHLNIVELFVDNGQVNNVVRFLLAKGARTAQTDANGKTALDIAEANHDEDGNNVDPLTVYE
uniref:Calpain catalytic domain-containing protein n=1 Tax=Globodera rostochiensis TaxID=31243 RepID=A0A914HV50_GLORO